MNSGIRRPSLRIALASIAGVAACLVPGVALAHHIDERIVGSAVVGGEQVEITTHGDPVPPAPTAPMASPRFAGIPTSWCGTPRTTDDIANETGSLDDGKIHLVYAYPSDQPNRFSTYANMIQGDVNAMADKIAAQEGSTRSIRFDLGTSGGVGCVDITIVPLPEDTAFYDGEGGGTFTRVIADVSPVFGFGWPDGHVAPPHPRNLLVYADRIVPGSSISGQGHRFIDSAPTGGPHNQGGLVAVSFYNASRWASDADTAEVTLRREISLHEVGHNLGAVQSGFGEDTPHGSGQSHCYDEWDVMCYDDSGPYFDGGGELVFNCGDEDESVPQLFDCGQDDYFRTTTPSPGSYLATHWNLYNSAFLCSVTPATGCVPTNLSVPPQPADPTGALPGAQSATPSKGTRKKCGKKNRPSSAKRKRCKKRR